MNFASAIKLTCTKNSKLFENIKYEYKIIRKLNVKFTNEYLWKSFYKNNFQTFVFEILLRKKLPLSNCIENFIKNYFKKEFLAF